MIMDAVHPYLCVLPQLKKNVRFQLFGCDIAPDKDLNVRLLEMNKGPDFKPKDERDKNVKMKVHGDIMDLIDDNNNIDLEENNDFDKIWEVKI